MQKIGPNGGGQSAVANPDRWEKPKDEEEERVLLIPTS